MKVKSDSEVTQSCPTLHDPMDCSLPGSSVHGICHARVLEQVAILPLLILGILLIFQIAQGTDILSDNIVSVDPTSR